MIAQCTRIANSESGPPDTLDKSMRSGKKRQRWLFEQRHSGCRNSLNPKCALREAVASSSPKVLHWLLSSVGELRTLRHNSCDRHLPGFSTTTHKTKCTFQSPALVSTSCHDSSLIVLFFFFFSTSRETHKKTPQKPKSCISHRQLKHIIASVSKGMVL